MPCKPAVESCSLKGLFQQTGLEGRQIEPGVQMPGQINDSRGSLRTITESGLLFYSIFLAFATNAMSRALLKAAGIIFLQIPFSDNFQVVPEMAGNNKCQRIYRNKTAAGNTTPLPVAFGKTFKQMQGACS